MREIPRSMIQLAFENGAKIQFGDNDSNWVTLTDLSTDLFLDSKYRIANKTADGLRLGELLELADWNIKNIDEESCDISKFKDFGEWLFWTCREPEHICNISLKKPAPKMRPMTAQEIAMLPNGTAFVYDDTIVYNPRISVSPSDEDDLYVDSDHINYCKGHILPNETELRQFEVEA